MNEPVVINLGELGIGFKELADLAKMLSELAETGKLYGEEYDLDSLKVLYNPNFGTIDLFDDYGATTIESEES